MTANMELVKMSIKGQLVVPQEIREIAKLNPGERFVAFPVQEGVLFKKVIIPQVKLDFDALSKEIESQFRKAKIEKKDVGESIKWARKK